MNQDFSTTGPNQKFCADITYVYTKQDSWTYLAEVIDLYSRKIVGYAYSKTMTAKMAVEALKNAVEPLKDTIGIKLFRLISEHSIQVINLKNFC